MSYQVFKERIIREDEVKAFETRLSPHQNAAMVRPVLSVVCFLLSAVCYSLSADFCLLFAVCCLPSAVCYLLSTVCCVLSAVRSLLSAARCLLSAVQPLDRLYGKAATVVIPCNTSPTTVADCQTDSNIFLEGIWPLATTPSSPLTSLHNSHHAPSRFRRTA
jgi:hypothetical protein